MFHENLNYYLYNFGYNLLNSINFLNKMKLEEEEGIEKFEGNINLATDKTTEQ